MLQLQLFLSSTETTLSVQIIPQGTPLSEAEMYPISKVCIHSRLGNTGKSQGWLIEKCMSRK